LSDAGPSATAAFRILLALPLLWWWAEWERRRPDESIPPATFQEFVGLALAGLLFAADLAIWHWSLQFTSVANSTLLANLAPVLMASGAWWLLGEKVNPRQVSALVLAILGAALLAIESVDLSPRHVLGDGLALGAAFFYAGYLLSVKHLRRRFSTATIMAWSGLVSCPTLFLVAALSNEDLVPSSYLGWMAVAALALVSHAGGQTLIAYSLGHLPASFSAVALLWQPVVAAVVAWIVLKEPLSWVQMGGGTIILGGILLATRNRT
jgi:drug/metabolite transporter (DMT)-like permease